jgi:hypothetical protein
MVVPGTMSTMVWDVPGTVVLSTTMVVQCTMVVLSLAGIVWLVVCQVYQWYPVKYTNGTMDRGTYLGTKVRTS